LSIQFIIAAHIFRTESKSHAFAATAYSVNLAPAIIFASFAVIHDAVAAGGEHAARPAGVGCGVAAGRAVVALLAVRVIDHIVAAARELARRPARIRRRVAAGAAAVARLAGRLVHAAIAALGRGAILVAGVPLQAES
jgi:hypothetical protein